MKTIVYNPQREILTALLTLILSFCILTAVKAQGNSGPQPANENKKEVNETKTLVLKNNDAASVLESEKILAEKIEFWMNSGSYWEKTSEEELTVDALARDIKKWMTNGSFWTSGKDEKTDLDEIALSGKGEITCDALAEEGNN